MSAKIAKAQDEVSADETISGVLDGLTWDSGVAWSLNNEEFVNTETIKIIGKWGFYLNIGYAPSDTIIAGVSYDNIPKLKDLGVDIPILDQLTLQPAVYYGYSRINLQNVTTSEDDWFVGAKAISLTF